MNKMPNQSATTSKVLSSLLRRKNSAYFIAASLGLILLISSTLFTNNFKENKINNSNDNLNYFADTPMRHLLKEYPTQNDYFMMQCEMAGFKTNMCISMLKTYKERLVDHKI